MIEKMQADMHYLLYKLIIIKMVVLIFELSICKLHWLWGAFMLLNNDEFGESMGGETKIGEKR